MLEPNFSQYNCLGACEKMITFQVCWNIGMHAVDAELIDLVKHGKWAYFQGMVWESFPMVREAWGNLVIDHVLPGLRIII